MVNKLNTQIGRGVSTFWAISLNAILLFALVNVGIHFFYTNKLQQTFEERQRLASDREDWAKLYSYEFLETLYPDQSRSKIARYANGFTGRGVVYRPFFQFQTEPGIIVGFLPTGENAPYRLAGDAQPSRQVIDLALAGATEPALRNNFMKMTSWAIHRDGFRLIGPGQGPWPPAKDSFVVFVFGGSAALGSGVSDNETIASYLQSIMRERISAKRVDVYNFGTASHFLSQERAFFESLASQGYIPDIALFIDGVLEFYHPEGMPGLTTYIESLFFNERVDALDHNLKWYAVEFFKRLPVVVWAMDMRSKSSPVLAAVATTTPEPLSAKEEEKLKDPVVLDRIINRYNRDMTLTKAIGDALGVETLFVWQPSSLYKLDGPTVPATFDPPMRRAKYGYERMAEFIQQSPLPSSFVWCADIQQNIKRHMYLDGAHYTPWGSLQVAKCVFEGLLRPQFQLSIKPVE